MKKFLLLSSILIALGANAAAYAGGITPPIGNYTGVREQDRVIYPHPADLAAPSSEDRRLYDHPAVVVCEAYETNRDTSCRADAAPRALALRGQSKQVRNLAKRTSL